MTEVTEVTEQDHHGDTETRRYRVVAPRCARLTRGRAANTRSLNTVHSLCLSLVPGLDAGRRPARDHCYPECSVPPRLRVKGLSRVLRPLR